MTDLHPLEQKVIEGLKKLNGKGTAEEVAQAGGIEKIQAERFGYSLSQKNIVKLEKKTAENTKLTELGNKYLEQGMPEKQILEALQSGKCSVKDLAGKTSLTEKEISACLGILKKNAFIAILPSDKGMEIELTGLGKEQIGKKLEIENTLGEVSEGREISKEKLEELRRRGLVEVESSSSYILELTGEVKDLGKAGTHQLTHDMLKTGTWKETKLRGYDLKAQVPAYYGGRLHPLTAAINKIRRIFLELGFEEAEGPIVESSFWNFDALFQPQDHPARDLADTFYLKNPKECKLPNAKTVSEVKKAHEKGIENSKGWGYAWKEELAKRPVLRTHTTAVTARALARIEPPAKIFCIGRTYRNETPDFKHLPEFTQIDGIVVDESVTFKDLLGYLKEFFYRLGFEKIRFRPSYFPYTEMSVEPEVYLEEKGEWIELGGSGIFRPEVNEPLGINVPVLAWGLSLERPIMLKLGLEDIREFYYKNDLKMLREAALF